MWTGSWWWDQQKSLPPGSTVIPVLLASDKTQLTQHHGDKSSHPVYITIGNLDKRIRRAQTRPSKILLGFLPSIDKDHYGLVGGKKYTFRRAIVNAAMAVMLRELEVTEAQGLQLRCADGQIRHCFPIIGGFSLDYEEQAFLTGVKNGEHCVVCRIPPNERADLLPLERFPLRDHRYTQDLIRQLRAVSLKRKRCSSNGSGRPIELKIAKEMSVDDVVSFMWSFKRVNIHEIMHVDILHQCLKGIIHRSLNDWVLSALQNEHGDTKATAAMDKRFGSIPPFPNLRRFPSYSSITQWTGVEQKALLRQMVPALAPLLPTGMIQFLRAVADFTLHAQYYSHDCDTLSWLEAALTRMDVFKEAFREFTAPGTGFNIPKLHAITHYPMMIRKFGSADGYDTAMFEAGHRYIIKDWYPLTNKQKSFEQQIFEHNQRAVNMLAMHDLIQFRIASSATPASKDDPVQVTGVSRPVDLNALQWPTSGPLEDQTLKLMSRFIPKRTKSAHLRRGPRYWRYASTIAKIIGESEVLEALAVFVREERQRASGVVSSNIAVNKRESDASWINNYLICIHPSISCWKSDRDDGTNADVLVKEMVRCDPNWQQSRQWRRDCVWVQEYLDTVYRHWPLQGRLPAQLRLIVSVLDMKLLRDTGHTKVYTGAFVDIHSLRDQGRQSRKHGMIEVQRHPLSHAKDRRSLGYQRFYHLGLILRSAHLVPASDQATGIYYINSYVDWDQYATVYDPDFIEKDAAVARQFRSANGV